MLQKMALTEDPERQMVTKAVPTYTHTHTHTDRLVIALCKPITMHECMNMVNLRNMFVSKTFVVEENPVQYRPDE